MLESEHLPGAAKPGLHFVGNQEGSVFAAKFLCTNEEIRLRCLAAFSLHGLNDERGDIARTQLPI